MKFFIRSSTILFSILFLFVISFGIFAGMNHIGEIWPASAGHIGCVHMNSADICPMSLSEHISYWFNIFSMALDSNGYVFYSVLFAALYAFCFRIIYHSFPSGFFAPARRFFSNKKQKFKHYNHLFFAISRGILNPRIYA